MNLQFQRQTNQITIKDLINFDLTIIYGLYPFNRCLASFHLSFDMYILNGLSFINNYQQSGDTKKPYLAQYSEVVEDSPVIKS